MERDLLQREINNLILEPQYDHFMKFSVSNLLSNATIKIINSHPISGDYTTGNIEGIDIAVRNKANGQIKLVNKKQLSYLNNTEITLLGSDGLWIKVKGQASYKDKKNNWVSLTQNGSPIETEGWIDRIYTNMPLGKFDNLIIEDKTKFTSKKGNIIRLSKEELMGQITTVLLHQTESTTARSTLSEYTARARFEREVDERHVGSHYIIDENGNLILTAGINELVNHVGTLKKGFKLKHSEAIAIEHVGMAHNFSAIKNEKDLKNAVEKADFFSPKFKNNLLLKSNSELWGTISKHKMLIHKDISAVQKRASYLLIKCLKSRYGGNIFLQAHFVVAEKTIGEGENIVEFHQTMEEYPRKVKYLTKLIHDSKFSNMSVKDLLNDNGALWDKLKNVPLTENVVLDALNRDATHQENTALKKGDADAQKRESLRIEFYEKFYLRMGQIDSLINILTPQPNNRA